MQLNDKVLFAFDAFHKAHFLELAGPGGVAVKVGEPATFTVTDGSTGALIPVRGPEKRSTSASTECEQTDSFSAGLNGRRKM